MNSKLYRFNCPFLPVFLFLLLNWTGVARLQGAEKKHPDILFIAIDDMNDWTTLFDDKNPIKTPNLKRLAARGCFFSKAYCTTAACNPSRTAILTGQRPTTSGIYGNRQNWREILPDVVTLPQHFKNTGYSTIGAGKIFHHGRSGKERKNNPSFDKFFKMRSEGKASRVNYNGYTKKKSKYVGKGSFDWGMHEAKKHRDEHTVEYVNAVMETHPRDKSLFLAAGIYRPHLPFYAPKGTFDRYPFEKTVMPPMPENDLNDLPAIGKIMSSTQGFVWNLTSPPPQNRPGSLKKMVQCYQAASDYADQMVGRLLDKLDETGRSKDTIIVLWSDHGYHLGDKQACVKFTLWEKATHVPFIIVAPGVSTPGTRCDKPVSLIDIYPTLVELAGLPKRKGIDGKSIVPLLKEQKQDWHPALMTMGPGNHAVRSDRWRYIRYKDGSEELYDHKNDSWEITNLAGNKKYEKVILKHRKWLPKKETPIRDKDRNTWIYGPWKK